MKHLFPFFTQSLSSTGLIHSFRCVFFVLFFVCLQRNLSGEAESGKRLASQSWKQERRGGRTRSLGEWEGWEPERKGSRQRERWASLHYHVTILLTSYLQLLAWEQCSSHRPPHCVLQGNLRQSSGLTAGRKHEQLEKSRTENSGRQL